MRSAMRNKAITKSITKPVTTRKPLDRRLLFKSAGVLLGMAAMPGGGVAAWSDPRSSAHPGSGVAHPGTGELSKRMLGFMLPHEQFSVPELVKFGVSAEHAGFDFVATSDHFQPRQANEGHSGMAWITIGALGQQTDRIWIGTTVTCPTYRYNPAVVAEGFASLALLTPGRIFLGVGSGEALNEEAAIGAWGTWSERAERLIEATQLIRELWKGAHVIHRDRHYNVNARLYDVPPTPVPILMAANGPKAMRRAGQYGDGLVTDPKTWKQHKSEFMDGLKQAAKDPKRVPVLIEQYVVVGGQQELHQAAELWRFGPKAWNPYYNIADPRFIEERAKREIPLEKVYEGWPIGTDPQVHIRTINELFESGATMVNIHTGQSDQLRAIEFYGRLVLPKLRAAAAH